jgi:spermidine synthase
MNPIARIPSEFGEIVVSRNDATGVVRYDQGRTHQSEADGNGVSLVPYIHAIYDLLLQAGCREALVIGCGGGTLATMLHRAGVKVAIVDIDSWSFRLARQYFQLPVAVDCHAVDGAAFLAAGGPAYDGIVLDAYVGNRLPPEFAAPSFLQAVRNRLTAVTGVFIANIHVLDDSDAAAGRYAAEAANVWPLVRLLDTPGEMNRNTLVIAGAPEALNPPTLRVAPTIDAEEIALALSRLSFLA